MPDSDKAGEFYDAAYVALVSRESRGTPVADQVAFIEGHLIAGRDTISLLDLCCGHGRHLLRLQRPGRSLTGVDKNGYFLTVARTRVNSSVELLQADARYFSRPGVFDVVLCLENSFCFEGEDAARVAGVIMTALRPGGLAMIHLVNPWFAEHKLPHSTSAETDDGWVFVEQRVYDKTHVSITQQRFRSVDGTRREAVTHHLRHRLYHLEELIAIARAAGLAPAACFGTFQGGPVAPDAPNIICIFTKGASQTG